MALRPGGSGGTARVEPRWPPALAILVTLLVVQGLPDHYQLFPSWAHGGIAAAAWLALLGTSAGPARRFWLRLEGALLMAVAGIILAASTVSLAILIRDIIVGSKVASGLELLTSSVVLWICVVMAFSLVYWLIDGGGPDGPRAGRGERGDWLFAQAPGSPGRPPYYVDYLFLAFSTSVSFSTTDTVPVTPKAKLLMMVQSLLAMTTLVVVASRAINILGS